jgi:rhodanese-related sulfurtransferase
VAARLVQLGYKHVYDYEDGKADWVEAGFPLES